MNRVSFLKGVDRWLGGLSLLLSSPQSTSRLLGRVLLVRPGGIGDAALLAPAIGALMSRFPGAAVDVLAERRNAGVFPLVPGIRSLFLYDRPADLLKVLSRCYDVVIDTEQWHRLSAVVARLVRSGMKIGYGTNERRRMFTHTVDYSHERYEAESFLDLLEPLEIDAKFSPEEPFLLVPPESACRADELLAGSGRCVTIFPGASIPERRWGRERFRDLALRLERVGLCPVVVGGPDDCGDGDAIIAGTQGYNLAGKSSLSETVAVLARSALLVSGDSGVLHLAVGLGIPTVSLFGPGIEAKWGPRGARHVVINRRLACSPCTRFGTTPSCPYGARCMVEIGVDEVEAAVFEVLRKDFARGS